MILQGAGPSSHIDHNVAVRRPFEGELASTTVWPETEKVFGHGYEVRLLNSLATLKIKTVSV
jgi:hypothetical protein